MRSPDFFDAARFPTITFKSDRIIANTAGRYTAHGILTIRGVSKNITLPFSITDKIKDPWGNTRRGVEASLKLNRIDYGVAWNAKTTEGGLVVGHDVNVELTLEMILQK